MAEASVASDFLSRYKQLCLERNVCSQRSIAKHFKNFKLDLPLDAIRSENWPVFLQALSNDKSLRHIRLFGCTKSWDEASEKIRKTVQRKPKFFIYAKTPVDSVILLCKSLSSCLQSTKDLMYLKLESLQLTCAAAKHLAEGLRLNTSLRVLSFEGTKLDDETVSVICRSLRHTSKVEWINFTSCSLTLTGIQSVACLLKFQGNRKRSDIWYKSLRYEKAELDSITGIMRLTLSENPLFSDAGAKILSEVLTDDLFLKALDVRECKIGDKGGAAFLQVLKANCMLELLDLNRNPISPDLSRDLEWQMMCNNGSRPIRFSCLPVNLPETSRFLKMRIPPDFKVPIKTTRSKNVPKVLCSNKPSTLNCGENTESKQVLKSGEHPLKEENFLNLTYTQEDKRWKSLQRSLKKLKKDNIQLKILLESREDFKFAETTFHHIVAAFQKFEKFLGLMNEAGLSHLAIENLRKENNDQNAKETISQLLKPYGAGDSALTSFKFISGGPTQISNKQENQQMCSKQDNSEQDDIRSLLVKIKELIERQSGDGQYNQERTSMAKNLKTVQSSELVNSTQLSPIVTCALCSQMLQNNEIPQDVHVETRMEPNKDNVSLHASDRSKSTSSLKSSSKKSSKRDNFQVKNEQSNEQNENELIQKSNNIFMDARIGSLGKNTDESDSKTITPCSEVHSKTVSEKYSDEELQPLNLSQKKESEYADSFEQDSFSQASSSFSEIEVSSHASLMSEKVADVFSQKSPISIASLKNVPVTADIFKNLNSSPTELILIPKADKIEVSYLKSNLNDSSKSLLVEDVKDDEKASNLSKSSKDDKKVETKENLNKEDLEKQKQLNTEKKQRETYSDPELKSLLEGNLSLSSQDSSLKTEDIMHCLSSSE